MNEGRFTSYQRENSTLCGMSLTSSRFNRAWLTNSVRIPKMNAGGKRPPTQITPRNHIQTRGKIPVPNAPLQLRGPAFFHAQSIITIKYLLSARRFNFIHCLLCLLHSIFLRDTVRTTAGVKFRPPARRMDKHRAETCGRVRRRTFVI